MLFRRDPFFDRILRGAEKSDKQFYFFGVPQETKLPYLEGEVNQSALCAGVDRSEGGVGDVVVLTGKTQSAVELPSEFETCTEFKGVT